MISTIPGMLQETVVEYASKAALFGGGASLTFSKLTNEALATAQILKEMGVRKGDRIGICMSKTLDQAVAILGVLYANAVFVPILPKLKETNIKHIVNDSDMTAIIADSSRIHEVASYADRARMIVGHGWVDGPYSSLPDLRGSINHSSNFFSCIGADNAAIIYSSGSTGRPKGIVISHRNLFDGARIISTYLKTTSEDRICGALSLDFDYGLNQLWQTIYKGATLYLHEFVFPSDLFELLSSEQLTALPVMPVIITRMFDGRFYIPNDAHDFTSLRYICSSGGVVSQAMMNNLKMTFPKSEFYSMYGLTEAFRSTYLAPEQLALRPTSIGKAIPDVEVYVMDDDYNICPPNTPGVLVHRGGCIAKGYWNDPERTAEVFRQIPQFPGELVVFTGDLVKTDEEGYLYFISRRDSLIKTHGYRVSPLEVEEEVITYGGVTEALAFGVPNLEIGEQIVVAYTTDSGRPLEPDSLTQHMKKAVPWYMVPTYLVHMEGFPSTGNDGKVDRSTVQAESRKLLGLATIKGDRVYHASQEYEYQ